MVGRRGVQVPNQAERLLEAAARCFAKKGFRGTTVDDIAAEAGMSRPLLYKHFDGKDQLIDAVLDDLLGEWEAQAGEAIEYASASEALRTKLEREVGFAMERPLLQAIFQQDPRVLMSGHAALFQRANAASRAKSERIVLWGQLTGEFADDLDPARTAETIELVVFSLGRRALGIDEGPIDARLIDEAVKLLLRGLRPPQQPHDGGP